ncbi:hypothetical protein [Natrialba swarupiae]|nr:hypothetical protein [Natrialba swarupiae]
MGLQLRNPFRWPLTVLGGILVLLGEAFFTGQAYRRWPDEFSPLTHYHSDLGMTVGGPPGANTALGAQYYNAGQVFIGLAVILFIGGLYVYYTGDRRRDALLTIGQLAGIFIGVALIMNGVYSLDFETGHAMWVIPMFLGITIGLVPINAALYRYPGFPRWIAGYGVLVAILPLGRYLLMYVTADPLFIAEWILIYAAFVWIFLVTIDAFRRGVLSNGFKRSSKAHQRDSPGNPFRWSLTALGGLFLLLGEAFFTGMAYSHWSGAFSPLSNFHSDLGGTVASGRGANTALGAQFYDAGQIFQGLALILFVGGLNIYYTRSRRRNAVLVAGQLVGLFVGVALIMNGIYSVDFDGHAALVIPLFLALSATLILLNIALYGHPQFPRVPAVYGGLVGLIPPVMLYVTTPMLESPFVVEWILIYGAMLWVLLVVVDVLLGEIQQSN